MRRMFDRAGWTLDRIALGLVAIFMLPAGLQAAFAPESFYTDFPFGRGWIAASGEAYDEHLVRDVGALFLALVLATLWSVVKKWPLTGLAAAWLLQGILHFAYHVGHLDNLDGADKAGMVITLASVPILAALALWDSLRRAR